MNPAAALTQAGRARPGTADRIRWHSRSGAVPANMVLGGTLVSLLGISWDVQWHIEVGPDTFFTLPHLMLYSGSAIAGVTSLVMVLLATAAQRAGHPAQCAPGGTPVRIFGGTFHAPLGYLISGIGGALFLLYGLMDLWWHSLYGFDAVLDSPPHVALFLSISLTMVGSVIVFAAAREQRWGRTGIIVSVPVLITFTPLTTNAFVALPLPFDPKLAGTVFFCVLLLITGAFTLRTPRAALLIAAALSVMQAFLWWFSPWAAHVYAASVGLPLRDNLGNQAPALPSDIPMLVLVAAAVVEALLALGRRCGWSGRWLPQLMGAGGGLVVGVSVLVQSIFLSGGGRPATIDLVMSALVGLAFGALAGFLGARFAVLLRANTPATDLKGR